MVQAMGSLHVEDFAEERYGSLSKRPRSTAVDAPLNQLISGNHAFSLPPSQYNPLDEPSPLGLRLRKSPSLLDLIQMRLSQGSNAGTPLNSAEIAESESKKDVKGSSASSACDRLKASNFPALLLRIGSWEYVSKYEGDLVVKCYFAKHKLVWEILDGGLKSKIEIQWSDITGLKAECPDDSPGTLTVMLARKPAFYRETNPQPRKHTLWQATDDFTDGQASINKQHYIQCPPGTLDKHYVKIIQCDTRLGILSRHPEIVVDSLYFESEASSVREYPEVSNSDGSNQMPIVAAKGSPISVFESVTSTAAVQSPAASVKGSPISVFESVTSTAAVQSPATAAKRSPISVFESVTSKPAAQSPALKVEHIHFSDQHVSKEEASPQHITAMDKKAVEGVRIRDEDGDDHGGSKGNLESSKVPPTLRPSISMNDLVNHLENHISEQMTSGSLPSAKASECQDMLENITQALFNDTQSSTGFDEKSLMKKVNSLCCLLQDDEDEEVLGGKNVCFDLVNGSKETTSEGLVKQEPGLPRRDSLGDLLLNLPRIASLPKFLFGIAEDDHH